MLSVINQQFLEAVRDNQLNKLENLLSQGADIRAYGDEALKLSARNGQLEIVKVLIERGANINANDDYALKWAEHLGNDDVWQVLSAFIQEEKLLVAALGSMPLVAASDSVALVPAADFMLLVPEVASMAQNPIPSTKNSQRSKI